MKRMRYAVSALALAAMIGVVLPMGVAKPQSAESVGVSISERYAPVVTETSAVGPGAKVRETNGVSIYVSKRGKTLTLSQNGSVIGVYPVTLGGDSDKGDKSVEGDMRTPSGSFYVCLRNDKSVCYLALGVSYPNIEDAERGYKEGLITEAERDAIISANKKGETPPWTTALGGYIEIHGARKEGGATAGCVAVDNEVMDILWQYCPVGVPITIGP